jgi:hypothetical protein
MWLDACTEPLGAPRQVNTHGVLMSQNLKVSRGGGDEYDSEQQGSHEPYAKEVHFSPPLSAVLPFT